MVQPNRVKDMLVGKNALQKNDIKIKEHIKSNVKKFNRKSFDIDIIELSQEGYRLKVVVDAKKNGRLLMVDNPLYFINPPIMVPDGTKSTVIDEFGNSHDRDNFKEDLDEALQEIIVECLRITAKEII